VVDDAVEPETSDDAEPAEPQSRPTIEQEPAAPSVGASRQSKIRRQSPAELADSAEEEFEDEEDEFVVSPVPATFAARGAAAEDSDSTGRHIVQEGKHEKPQPEGSDKSATDDSEQLPTEVSDQDTSTGKH
ncbi:MAG: hypothetical protein L0G72_08015, partial [Brevibacterium aurantiacum]|nr:hypothetical protein [Brevibacterium aurantiacum]